jgi:hypothetical protein
VNCALDVKIYGTIIYLHGQPNAEPAFCVDCAETGMEGCTGILNAEEWFPNCGS